VQEKIQQAPLVDVRKLGEVLNFRIEIHVVTRFALGGEEVDGLRRGNRLDVLRFEAE
jgi:hypothetical protein